LFRHGWTIDFTVSATLINPQAKWSPINPNLGPSDGFSFSIGFHFDPVNEQLGLSFSQTDYYDATGLFVGVAGSAGGSTSSTVNQGNQHSKNKGSEFGVGLFESVQVGGTISSTEDMSSSSAAFGKYGGGLGAYCADTITYTNSSFTNPLSATPRVESRTEGNADTYTNSGFTSPLSVSP
jgi:hypothetical protein